MSAAEPSPTNPEPSPAMVTAPPGVARPIDRSPLPPPRPASGYPPNPTAGPSTGPSPSPSAGHGGDDGATAEATTPTGGPSTTGSSERPERAPKARTARDIAIAANDLLPLIVRGITAVGLLLHKARTARFGDNTVWLPEPDEAVAMGEPLARIAARHAPTELVTGDAADAMEFAVAAGAYAIAHGTNDAKLRGGIDPATDAPLAAPPVPAP